MGKFVIQGGGKIEGEIDVQGAKNAVLPILAATILNGGKNVIYNCPDLRDVSMTIAVLKNLGCRVKRQNKVLVVESDQISDCKIPEELMRQMRSSIIFLGAIIARCKKAVVSMPGGCEIGNRPIDLHLKALRKLGVDITEAHGYINCSAENLHGDNIQLDFPSVGATENIMLAACMAEGTTVITNAAREPEIVDLEQFLNRQGAKISGGGTDVIRIEGVKKLYGVEHTIIPDRIVSATYLAAAAATGGSVILRNTDASHMGAILAALREMGCRIYTEKARIILTAPAGRLKSIEKITTMPYPGFPTDIQSPFMSLCCIADGTTMFVENIFENRYQHVEELVRMGADIKVDGRVAVIQGVRRLSGARVVAKELRGGAALVVAGLAADGITEIENVKYIDRGYETIEIYLSACGAAIKREE
ncbi:MAG TPA: UDP-N-acetylglucosamine 1-carboxyvinyltransferase [Candidatus Avimonoglobus intestinipullorum]|uniref:UDP-N-acetylglucosamine 1-carboxyvinyltransferase n=1 Tax=Candidatus Avimonoglobus intestinipullorum TaxID=2840699 RepID=A0A9D1LV96_9FIRM|nr:UDP-N-acetylglucosamine 1-carboxyvinyltransferase [Candidatus Avimonoglobus intestinipullorum]